VGHMMRSKTYLVTCNRNLFLLSSDDELREVLKIDVESFYVVEPPWLPWRVQAICDGSEEAYWSGQDCLTTPGSDNYHFLFHCLYGWNILFVRAYNVREESLEWSICPSNIRFGMRVQLCGFILNWLVPLPMGNVAYGTYCNVRDFGHGSNKLVKVLVSTLI
jgi:hypothetical protein